MKKLFDRIYFFFLQRNYRSTIVPMGTVAKGYKVEAYGVKMHSSVHNKENLPNHLDLENIFHSLQSEHDYWGENKNNLCEMLDFCRRNNLKVHQEALENLRNYLNN